MWAYQATIRILPEWREVLGVERIVQATAVAIVPRRRHACISELLAHVGHPASFMAFYLIREWHWMLAYDLYALSDEPGLYAWCERSPVVIRAGALRVARAVGRLSHGRLYVEPAL
jgi:hypothetical protein